MVLVTKTGIMHLVLVTKKDLMHLVLVTKKGMKHSVLVTKQGIMPKKVQDLALHCWLSPSLLHVAPINSIMKIIIPT